MFSSGSPSQAVIPEAPREVQLTATVVDAVPEVFVVEEEPTQSGGDKVESAGAHEAAALDNEPAPSTQTEAANVTAAAFLAQEVDGSEAIGAYQADYRWPIASITKLMTAVVALERIGAETGVIISQAAVDTEGDSGSFTAGEEFTVKDLIAAMMTVSSNDAAAAVADYVGTPRFFDLMQEKAYELKMTETSFIDATGLSYLNQSTAQDVARLVRYIYETYPEILEVSKRSTNTITELVSKGKRTLKNINAFAGTSGFEGGKTGFTEESKGNLVSLFSYEGKVYTLVVFGTTDRFVETRKLFSWLKTALAESND
jgi:D-alanyl-D-alanine carboxypeptidase